MAASSSVTLVNLYSELNKFGQSGDYGRAAKIASKILQKKPDEAAAFHCKVVCLIQNSSFSEALNQINRNPVLGSGLVFEKAYCLYRMNKPADALSTINGISNQTVSLPLRELKAQVLYRLERYKECYDTYREIIKNTSDDYDDERETNLSAAVANLILNKPSTVVDVPEVEMHTYELCYNQACQLLMDGSYKEAKSKLDEAEQLCRSTLEDDDLEEEEIQDELAIIKVQKAYCLQMLGKEKDANIIYSSTLRQKPDDIGLVAVASNNIICINRDQNVFDSKKKLKGIMADGLVHKLTSSQRKSMLLNQCLLSLYTSQPDQVRNLVKEVDKTFPEESHEGQLILASQLAREKKLDDAMKVLENCTSSDEIGSIETRLALVQLLLMQGERKKACEILRKMQASGHKPGVVSALVTLYTADKRKEEASQVLKEAMDWYKKNKSSGASLGVMWRQAADFHLRLGEPELAAASLEELRRLNPTDSRTLAQLIIAYSQFDKKKAQLLSKDLPPVAKISGSIDINALESTSWSLGAKYIKKVGKTEGQPLSPATPPSPESPKTQSTPAENLLKKKRKKKRKKLLPKNYDPNIPPNPDRWLPRWERGGKKRRDRRAVESMKGTQGAATGQSDKYDVTKMKLPKPAAPQSPQPEPLGGTRQQMKYGQQKKRRKGGRH